MYQDLNPKESNFFRLHSMFQSKSYSHEQTSLSTHLVAKIWKPLLIFLSSRQPYIDILAPLSLYVYSSSPHHRFSHLGGCPISQSKYFSSTCKHVALHNSCTIFDSHYLRSTVHRTSTTITPLPSKLYNFTHTFNESVSTLQLPRFFLKNKKKLPRYNIDDWKKILHTLQKKWGKQILYNIINLFWQQWHQSLHVKESYVTLAIPHTTSGWISIVSSLVARSVIGQSKIHYKICSMMRRLKTSINLTDCKLKQTINQQIVKSSKSRSIWTWNK